MRNLNTKIRNEDYESTPVNAETSRTSLDTYISQYIYQNKL